MDDLSFYRDYGYMNIGPVVTEFMRWVLERTQGNPIFGVMREGRLLTRVANQLSGKSNTAQEVWLSRYVCLKAAITSLEDVEALENFLFRARGQLLRKAGILRHFELERFADSWPLSQTEEIGADNWKGVHAWLCEPQIAETLLAVTGRERANLMRYLRERGALKQDVLRLVDLGYAGNTQHALQKILNHEALSITTHGYYLVATAGIRHAERSGCKIEGFLSHAGLPQEFTSVFARTPELMEACLTTPGVGSLLGYDAQGQPICERSLVPQEQDQAVTAIQEGICAYVATHLTSERQTASALRALVERMLLSPSLEEATNLGAFQYDDNFGEVTVRGLARPEGGAVAYSDSLSRRQLIWPAATALIENPSLIS